MEIYELTAKYAVTVYRGRRTASILRQKLSECAGIVFFMISLLPAHDSKFHTRAATAGLRTTVRSEKSE